jgi:hypothetical protein
MLRVGRSRDRVPMRWIFSIYLILPRCRDSVVGIATGHRLDDRGFGVRVLVRSRIFSPPRRPDRLWGPPKPLSNGYRWLFPRGWSGRGVKLTTHLHLVARSRMMLYLQWCLINYVQGNFTTLLLAHRNLYYAFNFHPFCSVLQGLNFVAVELHSKMLFFYYLSITRSQTDVILQDYREEYRYSRSIYYKEMWLQGLGERTLEGTAHVMGNAVSGIGVILL